MIARQRANDAGLAGRDGQRHTAAEEHGGSHSWQRESSANVPGVAPFQQASKGWIASSIMKLACLTLDNIDATAPDNAARVATAPSP
jgi:hypothetical protein